MKHGDLSNHGGITIAFRMEDTLIKVRKNSGFSDFIRSFDKLYDYTMDVSVFSIIRRIHVNTDYNIVVVVSQSNSNKKAVQKALSHLPYCHVVYVNPFRTSEIETNLLTKEWEYYIDDNERRRSSFKVSHQGAVSLRDFLETCMKL